jgi:hypothetical protein
MEHVSDIELIGMLGGHLSPERRRAVEAHVAECASCSGRRDEMARTWNALGEWEEGPGQDMAPEILRRVSLQPSRVGLWQWPSVRIAATVLIAVGLGHVAGRFAASSRTDTGGDGAVVRVEDRDVTKALYLEALDGAARPGIAEALLDLPSGSEEVDR